MSPTPPPPPGPTDPPPPWPAGRPFGPGPGPDPGAPPSPTPPWPVPSPPGRARRALAIAVVVALGTAALVVGVVAARPDRADMAPAGIGRAADRPAPTPTTRPSPQTPRSPGTTAPTEWRPEAVVELVSFIQRERELTFEHPVAVDLLSESEYIEEVGGDDDGSFGFYDGYRIVGRGTEMTPALKGTLVHELTHVLDDQHFEIFAIDTRSGVAWEELVAYAGLVEGDAIRMEFAYDQMLIESGVDPEAVEDPPMADPGQPGESTEPGGEPPTMVGSHQSAVSPDQQYGTGITSLTDAIDESPHYIGEQLVDMLVHEGGNAAVDAAFLDPPRTTEHVLDPRSFLDRSGAVTVGDPVPTGVEGTTRRARSAGALNLYLLLAAGIDPLVALGAATGWGGEAAVSYDRSGHDCFDLAAVGDTEKDTAEIGEAFAAWSTSGVAAQASTTRRSDGAHVLTACDAGAGRSDTDPFDALVVASERGGHTWAAMEYDGLDAYDAFAFGDCVVHRLPLEVLVSPEVTAEGQSQVDEASASC